MGIEDRKARGKGDAGPSSLWPWVSLVAVCLLLVSVAMPAFAGGGSEPADSSALVQPAGAVAPRFEVRRCPTKISSQAALTRAIKCINNNAQELSDWVNWIWKCEQVVPVSQYGAPPLEGYVYRNPSPAPDTVRTGLDLDTSGGTPDYWLLVWKSSCGVS